MALFDKQLELITEGDLASLVENEVREGYQVEYKAAVHFGDKKDKVDFLAAVTSFANTAGGDLLIGVAASHGIPKSIPGWERVDIDTEKLRIENLIRDAVEPRVAFRIHEIRLDNGRMVLMLRVPWSWGQPHMVRVDHISRFYYRHSAGKDIMNVSQLRTAFALTTNLDRQIEEFRQGRTNRIKSGAAGYLPVASAPTFILHVVPLESFRMGFQIDPGNMMEKAKGRVLPLGTASNWFGFNLDGVYCVDNLKPCFAYTQIFRNGAVEGASRRFLFQNEDRNLIASGALTQHVSGYVGAVIAFYRGLNIQPPIAVILTIIGVSRHELATPFTGGGYMPYSFDRDELELPGTLVDDFSKPPREICRPIFDALWNSAGIERWPEPSC